MKEAFQMLEVLNINDPDITYTTDDNFVTCYEINTIN